jgi:hypothetical protein
MLGAMIRHSAGRIDKTQKYAQARLDHSIFELVTRYDRQEIELLDFLKGMAHNTWSGTRNYRRAQSEENDEQHTQIVDQQATLSPTTIDGINRPSSSYTSTTSTIPSFDKQYSTPNLNRKRVRSQSQAMGSTKKRPKTDS